MASIIPGYEYDIFISYRQKDNKYDGWVTEFVEHLKNEIEATFKEDVSIYFDENPHDGLLEIYNVDKSLELKLKSLVFIPIISQTYCDPKSFAWQNEFVAFNRIALTDPLGKDVKLVNGNICSRIIPVKIHELDTSDIELFEREIGSRIRSIEFIYESAGVNRPLKPSDNPDKNLNKTFYRDQINKVANTVKDVIYGLHPDPERRATKSYHTRGIADFSENLQPAATTKTFLSKRVYKATVLLASIGIILILAVLFIYPKHKRKPEAGLMSAETVNKAIAVLPVSNFTGNPDLDYIASGIQDALIGELGKLSNLTVRPEQSTLQFSKSQESIQQIAKKLSVNNIIESTIKGSEDNLQIEVRLVEAFPSEKYVWSSTFSQNWNNIGSVYNDIVRHIMDGLQVKVNPQDDKKLASNREHNPEILKAYNRGIYFMKKNTKEDFEKGIKYFNDAIEIDPADPLPYVGLAIGYGTASHTSGTDENASAKAKSYALKALSIDSTLTDAYVVLAERYLYTEWDFPATEHCLKRAMELNPNIPSVHYLFGWYYVLLNNPNQAISEMKKAVEIDPTDPVSQGYLAWLYMDFARFDDVITEARKLLQLQSDSTLAFYLIGSAYAEMGMFYEAIEIHRKGLAISPAYESGLGIAYARAGQKEKALEVVAKMEKQLDQWWYAWGLAELYATLGEKQKAIDCLEIAYKKHGDFIPWMNNGDIYFKPLKNEQRFKDIINKLNLPV
jgi:tetratricopeptide (TPR) repeat protein